MEAKSLETFAEGLDVPGPISMSALSLLNPGDPLQESWVSDPQSL